MEDTNHKLRRDDDLIKRIGENVRKFRKKKRLTIVQLHYQSGIGTTSLHNIEHGLINSSVSTIKVLCEILDVTPNDLFGYY